MTDDQDDAPTEPEADPLSVEEVSRSEVAALYELMGPAFDAIDARASSPGKTPQDVVPTGFMDLASVVRLPRTLPGTGRTELRSEAGGSISQLRDVERVKVLR